MNSELELANQAWAEYQRCMMTGATPEEAFVAGFLAGRCRLKMTDKAIDEVRRRYQANRQEGWT